MPPVPATLPTDNELVEEIKDYIWKSLIIRGVSDVAEIRECTEELFEEELEGVNPIHVEDLAGQMVDIRRHQLTELGGYSSRLSAAFQELKDRGVLALGDFSCCGTCGSGEAHDLMLERGMDGYVYFHEQDTDDLIDSGETYLGYGLNLPKRYTEEEWEALSEDAATRIYTELCRSMAEDTLTPVFERHGIDFHWDGDLSVRMHISNADFFRPLS
ncbi:hypothetical protein CPHO_00320 [Corynebacterium phocae]|uniref:DUF6891 domain-containing protein n=2 Tax=Corynebacterium phocae TaxID=161895 RepID=A0A1L7D0L8_9CORY|nr:hypothetical protein CPHO_00320 [Corynebacterium phocae]